MSKPLNYIRSRVSEVDAYDRPPLPPKKPWLLYPRRPKNRVNAGSGMKARKLLNRLNATELGARGTTAGGEG